MKHLLMSLCLILVMTSMLHAQVTKRVITTPSKEIKTLVKVYKSGKEVVKEKVTVRPAEKKKFRRVVKTNPKGQKVLRDVQTDAKGNNTVTISTYLENTAQKKRIQKKVLKNGKLLETILVTITKSGEVTERVEAHSDVTGLLTGTRITKWYPREGKEIITYSYFDKHNQLIKSQKHIKFKDNLGAQVEVIKNFDSTDKLLGKTIHRKLHTDGVDGHVIILKNASDVIIRKTFKSTFIENAEKITLTIIQDGMGKILKRIEDREKLKGVIREVVTKKNKKGLIQKIIKILCYGLDGVKLKGPFDVEEVKTEDENALTLKFSNKKEKLSISKIAYQILPLGQKYTTFAQTLPVTDPSGNFTTSVDISALATGKYTAWFKIDTIKKEKPQKVSYVLAVDFEKVQADQEEVWNFNLACAQVSQGSAKMNCTVESNKELAYTTIQQSAGGESLTDNYFGTNFELTSAFKGDVSFVSKGVDLQGNESAAVTFTKNIASAAPFLNILHNVISENFISLDLKGSYDPDQGNLTQMEVSYVKFSGETVTIPITLDEMRPYYIWLNVYEALYLDIKVTDDDGEFSFHKIDLSAAMIGFMNVNWTEGNTYEIDVSSYPNPYSQYYFHFYHEASGELIELQTDYPVVQYTFEKEGVWSVDWSYKDDNGVRFVVGNARIDVGGNIAPYATFQAQANDQHELIINMSQALDPDGSIVKYFLAVQTPEGTILQPTVTSADLVKTIPITSTGFHNIVLTVVDDKGMSSVQKQSLYLSAGSSTGGGGAPDPGGDPGPTPGTGGGTNGNPVAVLGVSFDSAGSLVLNGTMSFASSPDSYLIRYFYTAQNMTSGQYFNGDSENPIITLPNAQLGNWVIDFYVIDNQMRFSQIITQTFEGSGNDSSGAAINFDCIPDGLRVSCTALHFGGSVARYKVTYEFIETSFTTPSFTLNFSSPGVKEISVFAENQAGQPVSVVLSKIFTISDPNDSLAEFSCEHQADDFIRCKIDSLKGATAVQKDWMVLDTPIVGNGDTFEFEVNEGNTQYAIKLNLTSDQGNITEFHRSVDVGKLFAYLITNVSMSIANDSGNPYFNPTNSVVIHVLNPENKEFYVNYATNNMEIIPLDKIKVFENQIIINPGFMSEGKNDIQISLKNDSGQELVRSFELYAGSGTLDLLQGSNESYDIHPFNERYPKIFGVLGRATNLPKGPYVIIRKSSNNIIPLIVELEKGATASPRFTDYSIVDSGEYNLDFSSGSATWELVGEHSVIESGTGATPQQPALSLKPESSGLGIIRKHFTVQSDKKSLNSNFSVKESDSSALYVVLLKDITKNTYEIYFSNLAERNGGLGSTSLEIARGDLVGLEAHILNTKNVVVQRTSYDFMESAYASGEEGDAELILNQLKLSDVHLTKFVLITPHTQEEITSLSVDRLNSIRSIDPNYPGSTLGAWYMKLNSIWKTGWFELDSAYSLMANIEYSVKGHLNDFMALQPYLEVVFSKSSADGSSQEVVSDKLYLGSLSLEEGEQTLYMMQRPLFPNRFSGDLKLLADNWRIGDTIKVRGCLKTTLGEVTGACRDFKDLPALRWLDIRMGGTYSHGDSAHGGDKWINPLHVNLYPLGTQVSASLLINDVSFLHGIKTSQHKGHLSGNDLDILTPYAEYTKVTVGTGDDKRREFSPDELSAKELVDVFEQYPYLQQRVEKVFIGQKSSFTVPNHLATYDSFRWVLNNSCLNNGFMMSNYVKETGGHGDHHHMSLMSGFTLPKTQRLDSDTPFYIELDEQFLPTIKERKPKFKVFPMMDKEPKREMKVKVFKSKLVEYGDITYRKYDPIVPDANEWYSQVENDEEYHFVFEGDGDIGCKVISGNFIGHVGSKIEMLNFGGVGRPYVAISSNAENVVSPEVEVIDFKTILKDEEIPKIESDPLLQPSKYTVEFEVKYLYSFRNNIISYNQVESVIVKVKNTHVPPEGSMETLLSFSGTDPACTLGMSATYHYNDVEIRSYYPVFPYIVIKGTNGATYESLYGKGISNLSYQQLFSFTGYAYIHQDGALFGPAKQIYYGHVDNFQGKCTINQ